MDISALASGSSGNCFYIQNANSAILIDAGITAKQIVTRLNSLNLSPDKIKAIFITHEHSDHIRGADVFARQFGVPIYATKKTIESCTICANPGLLIPIKNNETINIGKMQIQAFTKSHNCADPVAYSITNDKKISIITDIGHGCKNVIENVSDSDFLAIESNHDIKMLEQGPYPYFLKELIASNHGHLSNLQSGLLVLEHAPAKLKHVMLSHLSKVNNTSLLALETFTNLLKERKNLNPVLTISQRNMPTSLFKI